MAVNELLHDAEHMQSGMVAALRDSAREIAGSFRMQRDEQIARALTIDPKQADDAWAETDLDPSLIGKVAESLENEGKPRCPVTGKVIPPHRL